MYLFSLFYYHNICFFIFNLLSKNYQLSLVIFYRGLTTRPEAKAKASAALLRINHGEELLLVQKNVTHDLNLHPRVVVVAGDRLQQRRILPSGAAPLVGVWPSRPVHQHRVQDRPVQGEQFVLPLFRNKRFALNKMFQRNASKFSIFYVL